MEFDINKLHLINWVASRDGVIRNTGQTGTDLKTGADRNETKLVARPELHTNNGIACDLTQFPITAGLWPHKLQ